MADVVAAGAALRALPAALAAGDEVLHAAPALAEAAGHGMARSTVELLGTADARRARELLALRRPTTAQVDELGDIVQRHADDGVEALITSIDGSYYGERLRAIDDLFKEGWTATKLRKDVQRDPQAAFVRAFALPTADEATAALAKLRERVDAEAGGTATRSMLGTGTLAAVQDALAATRARFGSASELEAALAAARAGS